MYFCLAQCSLYEGPYMNAGYYYYFYFYYYYKTECVNGSGLHKWVLKYVALAPHPTRQPPSCLTP